jgi:hypothetical protein
VQPFSDGGGSRQELAHAISVGTVVFMDLADLHQLAATGDFAAALDASHHNFGSVEANLEAACIRAWSLSRLQRKDEALAETKATLAAARAELGATHHLTLEALNDSARFASRSGLHHDAVTAGAQVLELRREVLGHQHLKTLTSWSNLIGYRLHAGEVIDRADADSLLKAWAVNDSDGSDKAHLAARLQVAQAFADKALAQACVAAYTALLGPSHPDTARAAGVLASIG